MPPPKDSKGRTVPGYDRHVFICGHSRPIDHPRGCCSEKNSMEIMQKMKSYSKKLGLGNRVRVQKSGCLDFCENGPTCVVYPEGIWYSLNEPELDIKEIVESHLRDGTPVERCFMNLE